MYEVKIDSDAAKELADLRGAERATIGRRIRESLTAAPLQMSGSKKRIELEGGSFTYQLRVGDFRVFDQVREADHLVVVTHVRRKGRKTTGEIL